MSFSTIVGQAPMKLALLLNAISPLVGGLLIRGAHGTGKTATVRALGGILPEQSGVAGCPYFCPPDDPSVQCERCRARASAGERLPVERRRMRLIDVPLNVSVDRLVGSIDWERAVATGEVHAEPGLLAEANRNLLYVDEVNLLDDGAVDVLLDAAALGVNHVEREGISLTHPSRFTLVGTMDPAEGELRPQLLDRFGLCVDVDRISAVEGRLAVISQGQRSQGQELGEKDDAALAARVEAARERLAGVSISRDIRRRIASLTGTSLAIEGHRADLVLIAATRALAALEGSPSVSERHVRRVAPFALVHRLPLDSIEAAYEAVASAVDAAFSNADSAASQVVTTEVAEEPQGENVRPSGAQRPDGVRLEREGEPLSLRRLIALPPDRVVRSTPGRRVATVTSRPSGRYSRATQQRPVTDLAIDATVRAAAPFQVERGRLPGQRLELRPPDLRQKRRRRKTRTLLVLAIDTSDSMGSRELRTAMQRILLAFLQDAYEKRDHIALVEFNWEDARLLLRPTASYTRARRIVDEIALGGTTPLASGMLRALEVIEHERRRDRTVYPLLVLITDGQANVSLSGQYQGDGPLADAMSVGQRIREKHVPAILVDTGPNFSARQSPWVTDRCRALADAMGSGYYILSRLLSNTLVERQPAAGSRQ